MLLRMLALAVGRICKPHSTRSLVASRTVIADIGPEPARLGLACSRREGRQRSIVAVQLVRIEHMAAQNFDHRFKQRCCLAHPPSKNRTIQLNTFARKDLRLTI